MAFAKLPEPKLQREPIEVADWGGTFYVSELPASVVEEIMKDPDVGDDNWTIGIEILARALTNEQGEHFERADILKHSPRVLRPLINLNNKLNGIREDEEKPEKNE